VTGNITGLSLNTTYYYRVAAQNNFGTDFGDTLSFTTSSSGTGTGTVSGTGSTTNQAHGSVLGVATTSGSGSTSGTTGTKASDTKNTRPSFISLEYSLNNGGALVVTSDDLKANPGDEFSYTVVYKNDTPYPYNEAVLKVIIPVEASYLNADREPTKISANTVEFSLGNIQPASQGTITIVSKVKETTKSGANLIFTSVLGYKDRFGVQLATTSYLTVRVGQGGQGTSLSAFSLGSLIGSTGIFILVIFAVIVLVAIFIYKLIKIRNGKNGKKDSDDLANFDIPSTFEPIGPANLPVLKR